MIFAKQGGKPAAPVDAIASKKGPVRSKFLSRPRVITQKMAAPDFSAVAFLFLLLFTVFFSFPKQNLLFLPIFSLPDPYPGIVFFNNWRI
ncbi:hypothetical protein [Mucilaginibacter gotjawali]|uniref:Uncharacterized protein n=1 Tax=Mucilaginibacter gotjawali TaxID=1550579 RepID=A0A839SDY4_9SPHI|nr:hypothetical protein [Mucilaginibacter gotjawali]MBB3055503.1 hypothetical protein [Mucilaginibacter gotjawali]